MKGSQEWEGLKPRIGFIMGDMKFLKSIYIVGRGWLTPYFTKTSSLFPPPFFFKFFPPLLPLHCHLQPPSWLFFLLSCFFGWIVDRTTFDVPFYLMIIWIYIYWALVPEGSWCVFVCFMQQSVKFTEFWQVMWVFTGTHSFFITYTNTQTYIAHSGASRLTHS